MNQTFTSQLPSFDIESITSTIERALGSAGLQTTSGPMQEVTETIRRALSSAGMPRGSSPRAAPDSGAARIDVVAPRIALAETEARPGITARVRPAGARGTFTSHQFRNHAGARAYKLFVPTTIPTAPVPLVVMLHGCTQSADDFATGTQMNRLAEEQGFLVVYPEQSPNGNGSKCWNWFKEQDQLRDSGEPSLIAGITREVAAGYPVDPGRIYVAGLSAGAAMAVILGETYPELYAAVGAHSGLPYAAAHDMPSAFAAMAGRTGVRAASKAAHFVPTIVFHGDQDQTVGQGNGAEIVRQASALAADGRDQALSVSTRNGVSPRGRAYSRTVYVDATQEPRIESWVLHGAGHAWSGGDANGSYTDGTGTDASAEMVRFFLGQRPASRPMQA